MVLMHSERINFIHSFIYSFRQSFIHLYCTVNRHGALQNNISKRFCYSAPRFYNLINKQENKRERLKDQLIDVPKSVSTGEINVVDVSDITSRIQEKGICVQVARSCNLSPPPHEAWVGQLIG